MELITPGANVTGAAGRDLINKAMRTFLVAEDLAGGTALTLNHAYLDDFAAPRTLTFSGSPADGDRVVLRLNVTTACVVTIPSSYRLGESSAITTISFAVGKHEIFWVRDDGIWWMADSSVATIGDLAEETAPLVSAFVEVFDAGVGTPKKVALKNLGTGIRQNSKSTAYTTVMADADTHILHPSADTTARTFTIDSNANVAYPIGTAITFVNQDGAGVVTIAITSDTMRLAGAGTTGSRTLAANGIATALKVTATEWLISGTGLT